MLSKKSLVLFLSAATLGLGACQKKEPTPPPAPAPSAPAPEAAAAPTPAPAASPAAAAPAGDQANCTYEVNPAEVALSWTAFKFTEKTAVKGKFAKTTATGTAKGATLPGLMKDWKMSVDGSTPDSADPVRNNNLKVSFFSKFNPPSEISAEVVKVDGDNEKGTLTIQIKMNGATKDVAFPYTVGADGAIEAKASIDILDFQLQAAFDSLHATCGGLHTGTDGVSKTWTQVDLTLNGKALKSCQ